MVLNLSTLADTYLKYKMKIKRLTQYMIPISVFVSMLTLVGCMQKSYNTLLDIHSMPEDAPKNISARFAWGLWKLDLQIITDSLTAGAQAYDLEKVVNSAQLIPQGKQLSPYALILESYYTRIYFAKNVAYICAMLDQLYSCVEFLIKQQISVDYGVTMLESNPTMREFVHNAIIRLNAERKAEGFLDEEGIHALDTLEKIQATIDKYQPK